MFSFLRRLFGKNVPPLVALDLERSEPSQAPVPAAVTSHEDEELTKRLERMEQVAMQRINQERERERLLSPEDRARESLNLPAKLTEADWMDGPFPFVRVLNRAGVEIVMDRAAFDYMYGESDLPSPVQVDLDKMLEQVVRIRVLAGGMMYGKPLETQVLADTDDPTAVTSFQMCMNILEDPCTFGHCMCLGGPTIELYSSEKLIGTIGVHHGRSIRWAKWKHDAILQDGERMVSWLAARGLSPESMR